jgi:small conductance mechanosensitive channel
MPAVSVKDLTTDLLIRYGFQILGALVILGVGLLLARWVGNLMGQWLERRNLEPPVRSLMVRTVRVVVLIFTLVVALDKFGFQVAPLVAGIGVAGLGLGIALQGVLGNVVAGLSIILTKPFRVGEWISIVGVYGQVSGIELFSTTLLHPDQSRVVIPNRKIVGEILHNYGRIRQVQVEVHVTYDADLNQALATIHEVLQANPRVLKDPAPLTQVIRLADSSVNIGVNPWVGAPDYGAARGEISKAIVETFRERGIVIPPPRRDVRLLGNAASPERRVA